MNLKELELTNIKEDDMKKIIILIVVILSFASCKDLIETEIQVKQNWKVTETITTGWKSNNGYILYDNININIYVKEVKNITENEVYQFIDNQKKQYKNGDAIKIFNGLEYHSIYKSIKYDVVSLIP